MSTNTTTCMGETGLPLELWMVVGKTSLQIHYQLMTSIPSYGKAMLNPKLASVMKSHFTICTVERGITTYTLNGKFHRDFDLPSWICEDGMTCYHQHGILHRDGDLPALVTSFYQYWHCNGQLHREGNQPAAVYSDGQKNWYYQGTWYATYRNGCYSLSRTGEGFENVTLDELLNYTVSQRVVRNHDFTS